jgi:hypothetical protein
MMIERAAREAAVRRYADYAARRKMLESVLVDMDAGTWSGGGLTRDEQTELRAAGYAAARAVVQRWRDDSLAQQEVALDEMEDVQTATSLLTK